MLQEVANPAVPGGGPHRVQQLFSDDVFLRKCLSNYNEYKGRCATDKKGHTASLLWRAHITDPAFFDATRGWDLLQEYHKWLKMSRDLTLPCLKSELKEYQRLKDSGKKQEAVRSYTSSYKNLNVFQLVVSTVPKKHASSYKNLHAKYT